MGLIWTKIHCESIPDAPKGWKWFKDIVQGSFQIHVGLKNGHETDLEMSPRPLGTTVFEEIYIRTMGK